MNGTDYSCAYMCTSSIWQIPFNRVTTIFIFKCWRKNSRFILIQWDIENKIHQYTRKTLFLNRLNLCSDKIPFWSLILESVFSMYSICISFFGKEITEKLSDIKKYCVLYNPTFNSYIRYGTIEHDYRTIKVPLLIFDHV